MTLSNGTENPRNRNLELTRRDLLLSSAAATVTTLLPVPGMADTFSERTAKSVLGTGYPRRDGPLKVRGIARYAAEHRYPNMVYGALVYSTIPRGRILKLETDIARAASGVAFVLTHENMPRLSPPEPFYASPSGMAGSAIPVMQDETIYWNGQPVAMVLASTQEEADYAASLINVEYEEAEAVTSFVAATENAPVAFYAGRDLEHRSGDAEAALADADVSIDLELSTPQQNHNQIEPHAVTVLWQDGVLRMHDCTQGVDFSAITIAKVFGIEPSQVHITAEFVGGGFGGKTLWQYHVLAAAAAQVIDRPVRVALTREGVYRMCGGRAPTRQRVAIGANSDGRITSLIQTGTTVKIAQNSMTEPFIEAAEHMYRSDTMHLQIRVGIRDMLANTFMRAPGAAVGTFGLEVGLDALAERLAIDPVELRIINDPDVDPTTGKAFSQRDFVGALREGARRFGWQPRSGERLGTRDGEWLVGTGMAAAYYPYKRFPGGAARVALNQDGRVIVDIAAHDMGMGTATAAAAVLADRLGVSYEIIDVRYGDNQLPGNMLAAASQQMAAIGSALTAVRDALVVELASILPEGAKLYGLPVESLTIQEGALVSISDPAVRIPMFEVLALAGQTEVSAEASAPPPSENKEWSMHSTGAVFTEVRVNEVTGEVRVPRITAVYDCGTILNSTLAASQFKSGIVMALGMALMESTHFDERNGRVANPSLAAYYMPSHMDVPEIDVGWTGVPDPQSPSGARGIGEISMTGLAPAISNAVYDATGKRVRDLPVTLDKLL